MSDLSKTSSSPVHGFQNVLHVILKNCRHTEIWGVDLKHAEGQVLEFILKKFLQRHATIPALQVSRARASLEGTLEWRRFSDPTILLDEAESILPDLDMCHITLQEGQHVLWVKIGATALKAYSPIHQNLMTSKGIVDLGLGVIENLSRLLLHAAVSSDQLEWSASCVIEFITPTIKNSRKGQRFPEKILRSAFEELVILIRHHYPGILGKAYIINPCDEYLASLDVEDDLLRNTVVLKDPEGLGRYLGSHIQPRSARIEEPTPAFDIVQSAKNPGKQTDSEVTENCATAKNDTEMTRTTKETTATAMNTDCTSPEGLETVDQKPRLIYSETIGQPSIILDPVDLQTAENLCPEKMGARIVFADSDMVVKFGHGVDLSEAEALHLTSTRTSIATPKLFSAYILDGVGYIIMSYEEGEPLEQYWDRVSQDQQDRILEQLQDYVNQMREIPGNFIGRLSDSPCRDGIFEAGYGDHTKYKYGPYPSEEKFNEGIIQALRDRMPRKVLDHEHDIESNFFNQEYILYQMVRGLKNHRIVFTHADLHPGNMIVRSDGTVFLLDWGLAGFWPEYWEFYRAMHNAHWRASWDRVVERFLFTWSIA
ncbi:kinase-like domain-containing protein [Penicillium capsulatum]|uniref:Kinase-like domain-containing protein n=1 Tax=Penicillium capsulatum TaxID=69766 RepID=A0A9W9IMV6_9EURO|nr:kinase-like domain-containing protein [Penicillium capsulatum]